MSVRSGSHQLSNGLMVSGRPEQQLKERQPTMGSRAVPYTGGDVKKSGELGRMYGVDLSSGDHHHYPPPVVPPKLPSRQPSSSQHNSGSARSGPNSGQMGKNSGPMSKKSSSSSFSGPMTPIQPTGLITSGPLSSNRRSGQLDAPAAPSSFKKAAYGSAVTSLGDEVKLGFKVSKVTMWMFLVVVVMGLVVGVFLMASVKKPVILVAVVALLVPIVVIFVWNYAYRNRGVLGFLNKYPDAELRGAVDGQFVKVTGIWIIYLIVESMKTGFSSKLTGNEAMLLCTVYLFQMLQVTSVSPRQYAYNINLGLKVYFGVENSWACVSFYLLQLASSDDSRSAKVVTCGSIPLETSFQKRHVADFYISDFQSGLRALVKAGYGAKVAPFVKSKVVVDVSKDSSKLSPNFLLWLSERGKSSDDRLTRLKEGYIKEGSTVSVMGVVRRLDNVLMIVPPSEPVSTGCRWPCCLLPTYIEGLTLTCDESQNADVIPV
ncbi:hypothetical protein SASPL_121202 [Salvia splendens]|uniref:Ubiquitin-specific protease family C19-related protein n=1 Tax=Salvia splendens TaxID=180675 RepID=A0A8X8ZX02_SALSN|nr:hypothetical protein SASPL_121202 [Salvia splendens]